jgi:hypothetical protein
MTLDRLTLQFSTTPLWQSGLIRLMSHSRFSHVDAIIKPGFPGIEAITPKPYGLLGASDNGVMIRVPNYHVFKERRRITLETDKADAIVDALVSQLGKPFDEEALHKAIDLNWRDWRDDGSWFCSELMMWALEEAGYFDDEKYPPKVDKNRVTPADLLLVLRGRFDPEEYAQDITE